MMTEIEKFAKKQGNIISNENDIWQIIIQHKPYISKDFTTGFDINDERQFYQCGNYRFNKEEENIAKGLIEIIYNMRNSLFHGELIPDNEANKIYGAAYKILRVLIDAI